MELARRLKLDRLIDMHVKLFRAPLVYHDSDHVLAQTEERGGQEKQLQPMGAAGAAWRMPGADLDGNSRWLEIARLAWNMARWIARRAMPEEVVRLERERFRQALVYVAAQLPRHGRQVAARSSSSHRGHESLPVGCLIDSILPASGDQLSAEIAPVRRREGGETEVRQGATTKSHLVPCVEEE